MRILYLASHWALRLHQAGGAGTHMRGTIAGFRASGHDVLPIIAGDAIHGEIATAAQPGALAEGPAHRRRIRLPVPVMVRSAYREYRQPCRDARFARRILSQVRAFNPTVIYERSWTMSFLGSILARGLRIPHFVETSGCMNEISHQGGNVLSVRLANLIEGFKLRHATMAVAEAHSAVSYIAAKFGVHPDRVVAKPLGIDPAAYPVDQALRATIIDQHQLGGKIVCGFIGSFQVYHGLELLLKAAGLVQNRRGDLVFAIIGWGSSGPSLQSLATHAGLKNVVFSGAVSGSAVGTYLSAMDIGLVPDSEQHMFPIKALEYGIHGACPVVPDYAAFSGLIRDGDTGRVFTPNDPQSLARIILELAEDADQRHRLGAAFRDKVRREMTWPQTVGGVLRRMHSAIDGHERDRSADSIVGAADGGPG